MPNPIWAAVVVLSLAQLIGLLAVLVSGARKPAETLTWLGFCLLVPLLGIPLYFILTGRVGKRSNLPWERPLPCFPDVRRTKGEEFAKLEFGMMEAGIMEARIMELGTKDDTALDINRGSKTRKAIQFAIQRFASSSLQVDMKTFHSGETFYEAVLHDMKRARYSIDVEFYIFRYDEVGRDIVELLLDKARSGVKVRFLRDGLGSRQFPPSVVKELQEGGVECRVFFPLRAPLLSRHLNHRDHCKIVVIDQKVGYTGGMNVGQEYAGRDPKYGPWRDTSVRIASDFRLPLLDLFEANFGIAEKEHEPKHAEKHINREGPGKDSKNLGTKIRVPSNGLFQRTDGYGQPQLEYGPDAPRSLQGEVQFVQSGPDTKQNLRELYFLCLTQATHQVEIITPYFLPESDLMMALTTAVARGVRVRLLLPERVDHRIIGMACQTYFPPLLDAGVEIYLYRPGVLHAKVMTVDGDVAIVGAANYDLRSFRLNYEVCLVQYGAAVTQQLRKQFEQDLLVSRRLLPSDLHTSLISRMKHMTARLAAPLC